MWSKIICILFISILSGNYAFSQQTPDKKDTTQLYQNIETYSKQSKFKRSIYILIFKPIASNKSKKKTKRKVYKKLIQKPYSDF